MFALPLFQKLLFYDMLNEKNHRGEQLQEAVEEREIDRLVYDLYGLSDDEIAIVEGTN